MADSAYSDVDRELVLRVRFELCLDFANTLAYRGSTPAESLRNEADLLKWCQDVGVIPSSLAPKLRAWFDKHPKRVADIFREAIALRELIYRMLHAIASGARPDEVDLALLNRSLRDAPARTKLQRVDGNLGWWVDATGPSVSWMLAPVLWSAADLLVSPLLAKLRECSNEKCLWLFLDDSKNGTRRWCSMQSCGNRAKAHRHYLRTRDG